MARRRFFKDRRRPTNPIDIAILKEGCEAALEQYDDLIPEIRAVLQEYERDTFVTAVKMSTLADDGTYSVDEIRENCAKVQRAKWEKLHGLQEDGLATAGSRLQGAAERGKAGGGR